METSERKRAMRAILRERRAQIPPMRRARLSAAIAGRVMELPAFQTCQWVFSYVSVDDEIDTRVLIEMALAARKQVAAPRCENGRMSFFEIASLAVLRAGFGGIPEPPPGARPAPQTERALCLVPGFSFDACGRRIGYGGGYYDRFLPTFTGMAVGLCFAELFSSHPLPCEPHDACVPLVVTENGVRAAEEEE